MHLMLDIETLSTRPDAAVFEVALVPFDEATEGAPMRFLWLPRTGHMCAETVQWWLRQTSPCPLLEASAAVGEPDKVRTLYAYLLDHMNDMLWANPASFDCVIVESLLRRYDLPMPISFRNWRDVRTLRMTAGWPPRPAGTGGQPHHAVDDCMSQIALVRECWKAMQR